MYRTLDNKAVGWPCFYPDFNFNNITLTFLYYYCCNFRGSVVHISSNGKVVL